MGKKFIVRSKDGGEFYGTIKERNGRDVTMTNVRSLRHWGGSWDDDASLMQLAIEGVAAPQKCRITAPVDEVTILDVYEILLCTEKAVESIDKVSAWRG